ncbi:putative disease resistance protein At3g14460 [Papaver somniferum]|uniref:putative disease resistance protein At3g14460 n=1 Tax=Papaver somniferum TaxID=3469 RepID=UPI000E6F95A5|nr:putative disease resistance protein At3g14460 [Papaver somniferum]
MHDLVHDLAQAVVGSHECAIVKVSELKNDFKGRRLQFIFDDELSTTFPETLSSLKKLRTIIILKPSSCLDLNKFSSNKRLRVLHFGFPGADLSKLPHSSARLRHLRYLHLSSFDLSEVTNDKSIHKFYNLQTLWLDLNHCNSLIAFPTSVTGLKFLRFLDMSFTPIETVPNFVTSLHNLQTLDVSSCSRLKALPEYVSGLADVRIFDFKACPLLEALPKDLGALTHLRYLSLNGTEIKVLPESCSNLSNLEFVHLSWCELPKEAKNWTNLGEFLYFKNETPTGIVKLVLLQGLSYKVPENVKNKPECNNGIADLRNLNFLEELFINHLQNVKDPVDAERANLKGEQNLRMLQLRWDEEMLGMTWDRNSCSFRVFEALQPNTSLRRLNILNFMGCELPTWMCVSSCLPKLDNLEFGNCREIKQLPAAIGQLQHLRFLTLRRMSLISLDIGGFSSLLQLSLTDMFLLKELCYSHPSLQYLNINGCNSLFEIPSLN